MKSPKDAFLILRFGLDSNTGALGFPLILRWSIKWNFVCYLTRVDRSGRQRFLTRMMVDSFQNNCPTERLQRSSTRPAGWWERPSLSDSSTHDAVTRSASRERFLALIAPYAVESRESELSRPANDGRINWNWIIDRARAHKVAGIVGHRLGDKAKHLLDAFQYSNLRSCQDDYCQQAMRCRTTLQRVVKAFGSAGADFLLLKGQSLSTKVYESDLIRPSSDVDILVRKNDLPRAEQALLSLGFRFPDQFSVGTKQRFRHLSYREFMERFSFHYQFSNAPDCVTVEVHWQLAQDGYLAVSESDLWSQQRQIMVHDMNVSTLSLEATLLHLCFHATKRGPYGIRLLHLCDIWHFVAHYAFDIEMVKLFSLAGQWGIEKTLLATLELCSRLFGPLSFDWPHKPWGLKRLFLTVATSEMIVDQRINKRKYRNLLPLLCGCSWDLGLHRKPRQIGNDLYFAKRQVLRQLRIPH